MGNQDNKKIYIDKIEDLKAILAKFTSHSDSLIVMYDKSTKRKTWYKPYRLNGSPSHIQAIVKELIKYLEKTLSERTIDQYDLELSVDDSIQVISKDLVKEATNIEAYISLKEEITPKLEKCEKMNFNFWCTKIIAQQEGVQEQITIYRKYNNVSASFRKSFKYYFAGAEIKEFKEELLCLDSIVDAFEYKGYFYVLNRNNFNSIFEFKDAYKQIIMEKKDVLIKSNLVTNAEQFINDCESDGRFMKRLVKVMLANDYQEFTNEPSKIAALKVNIRKLKESTTEKIDINLDKENRIIYKDKEGAGVVLNVLLDHYVKSLLTDRIMIAKAIENYNMGGD